MSANHSLGNRRSGGRRETCTALFYLLLLIVSVALVLDRMEVGRIVYRPTPNRSGNRHQDALLIAVETHDAAAVRRLLRSGRVDVNAIDKLGVTPIYYVLKKRGPGALTVLDALIDAGADVDGSAYSNLAPPLVFACNKRPDLVERLLRAGANPRCSTPNGWTALHYAAMCDDPATVDLLLSAGADPGASDDERRTPLDVARENGSHAVVQLLLSRRTPHPR